MPAFVCFIGCISDARRPTSAYLTLQGMRVNALYSGTAGDLGHGRARCDKLNTALHSLQKNRHWNNSENHVIVSPNNITLMQPCTTTIHNAVGSFLHHVMFVCFAGELTRSPSPTIRTNGVTSSSSNEALGHEWARRSAAQELLLSRTCHSFNSTDVT